MMTEALANIHIINRQARRSEKSNEIIKTNSAVNMFQMREDNVKRTGSFVVGQKLRESKWFTHSEQKIFCAVVESGFIIEHNSEEITNYGVAIWEPGFEKSKNSEHLAIYTITEQRGKFKVLRCNLFEFWPDGTKVRINNKSDKTETALAEDVIRNQILAVENSKRKWHNSEHFAYYCRYGPVENNLRLRKITDQVRVNTETFFLKIRRLTAR